MQTKQMWTMALVVAGLVAISACASSTPQAVDTAADEADLKAGTTTWLAAYNAGEVEKIMPLYAEDAVVMPPHAPVAVGHAAIREFLTQDSAGARAAGLKLVEGQASAGVSGDMGWNSGSFTVQDASGMTVDSGSYLSASRKVNGKWVMVRDTWYSDRPLPAAPAPAGSSGTK
jgi:ketosteroid isomerase-like protein